MGRRTRRRGALLVDTNLLVLFIVGSLDVEQVERFKRTRAYTREDYALLVAYFDEFARILTTPNVLTEVSNLVGQLTGPLRCQALTALGTLAKQFEEHFHTSRELFDQTQYTRLGLADASIIRTVDEDVTILTDDLDLYLHLSGAGFEAINFNHVRSGSW